MWRDLGVWIVVALALIAGGAAIGWGVRANHDAKDVAAAQGNFETCKTTASAQTDALEKIRTQLADEKDKADKLQAQAATLVSARDAALAAIEQKGRDDAAEIERQGHEDADSAALARLPVPAALVGRLWPGSASSTGAAASH